MTLQDLIDTFQKLIFSQLRGGNECKISALVPLVQESYGIYKFITSMLRAMHTTTSNDDALEPLRGRYDTQYYRLVKFYYECANLRYLTSLISIPKLAEEPPNLLADDEAPQLPERPKEAPPAPAPAPEPEPEADAMTNFWEDSQRRQQEEFDAQQRHLQEQWQRQQMQQQQQQQAAQLEFEKQQRLLQEQQQLENQRLAAQQYHAQTSGRMAELEQENLAARAQYERDQLMLEQYDRRLKDMESQYQRLEDTFRQQTASKDDQIGALQEQVNVWRSKYEALAKLYSQLRSEHLDLLSKFKNAQLKASSAQEAIDRREKLERELKTKNLELADMIRERDRALHEVDRSKGTSKDEAEKLRRELRMALDKAEQAEQAKASELSLILGRTNREISDLQDALRQKNKEVDAIQNSEATRDLEAELQATREELEISKAAMDEALMQQAQSQSQPQGQTSLIDAVLRGGIQRIEASLYSTADTKPEYLLSQVEKASGAVTEFAMAFNSYIADGSAEDVILGVNMLSGAIAEVSGGLLPDLTRKAASAAKQYLTELKSESLEGLSDIRQTDVVINGAHEVQMCLQEVTKAADAMVTTSEGNIDDELAAAADAVAAAARRLAALKRKPTSLPKASALLGNSGDITTAIAALIAAATACQKEIVARGKGSSSPEQFYKKNHRWTEGLISAAKAVASATNLLIETADSVLGGKRPEYLIVASNEVSAATAQLVAAARVKAEFGSTTQDTLEQASRDVGRAVKSLVAQVRTLGTAEEDYSGLTAHEFKIREMETQVEIVKLRNSLEDAVRRLGEMRKLSYQEE